jgi:hypothetical protein
MREWSLMGVRRFGVNRMIPLFTLYAAVTVSLARTILNMSGDMKICPKCNKTTLEPTLDCVVPPEMIGLLQQPIPSGSDPRVMPYFCLSCRCVELYPVAT